MMKELQKLGFREIVGIARPERSRYVYLSARCELQDSAVVVDVFPGNPPHGKTSVMARGTYLRKDCMIVSFEHAGIVDTSLSAKDALEKTFVRLEEDLGSADYYVDISKSIHQIWARKMLDAIKGLDN